MKVFPPSFLSGLAVVGLLAVDLAAQQVALAREDYTSPPDPVLSILTSEAMTGQVAPRDLGARGTHFIVGVSGGMTPLQKFARPYVNLGELPLDHIANRSRGLSTGNTVAYHLVDARTGAHTPIESPEGQTVSGAEWSPDGHHVAFMVHEDEASTLWVADGESGAARRVTDAPLNATMVTSFSWTGDSKHLVATLVPEGRGPLPERNPVADTPQVWLTHPGEAPSRTYRFLLKTPYDMKLLEFLTTSQLAVIRVDNGEVHEVGQPAMITRVDPSPDGKHFRVTTMQKPFSYFTTTRSFGSLEEIWGRDGKVLTQLNETKIRLPGSNNGPGRPGQGDAQDDEKDKEEPKRSIEWRADGKGLMFLQREPKKEEPKKDEPKTDGDAKAGDKKDGDKPDATKTADKADPPTATPGGGARGRRAGGRAGAAAGRGAAAGAAGRQDAPRGGAAREEKRKDRVMLWKPPFSDKSTDVVWASENTISSVRTSDDCKTLFVTQTVDRKRQIVAVKLAKPDEQILIWEAKGGDDEDDATPTPVRRRGGGGGGVGLLTKTGPMGRTVVHQSKDKKSVFLRGTDRPDDDKEATESARPWIDRVTFGSTDATRLWQAEGVGVRENLVGVADADVTALFLTRESASKVPNTFRRELESGEETALTRNVDPAPTVTAAERQRFQVTRVDGFKFWVKVTIPRNYGKQLPALFWFYPREYSSQEAYDRGVRTPDPNQFPMMRTRSMPLLTTHGYVVVEPDCPIVGEEGRMNDNYVGDLRNSLWAVIDELDRREIIDRSRLAIGGHSYGAFGTANAMVHTPFFKAGIAGDGNYNRTLTPMSFQSERRDIWEAREVYLRMSPLLWAEQLNGALLMYHGMDDNNTGTFPIHAPRMFQALDGLGKPASLYMYPYEGHGPGARETILDLWSRWIGWLDMHVKNPGAVEAEMIEPATVSTNEGHGG